MSLTPARIALVKATAPALKKHGVAITTTFYKNLLGDNPSLRNVFNLSSQSDGSQPRALANAVLSYATYIEDLPRLRHAVERIAHKHASLSVRPDQYPLVGKYLLSAIATVLGDKATPDILDAWGAAYGALAEVFINREAELYKATAASATESGWSATHGGWRKFRVAERIPESDTIDTFVLTPVDGRTPLPTFLPGQYVSLQVWVPSLAVNQSRQYSLSAAPSASMDAYRISVKREMGSGAAAPAGLVSNMLHNEYPVGSVVELSHPRGEFFLDPADEALSKDPTVLLSLGVGATPLVSILDAVVASGRPISWVHGSHSTAHRPFASKVRNLCGRHANLHARNFLSVLGDGDDLGVDYDFEGRLDLGRLQAQGDLFIEDPAAEYYVCGPEEWMIDVRRWLGEHGVGRERVHLELFATGDVPEEEAVPNGEGPIPNGNTA